MATFILVAGAWHGGWCWEAVASLLRAAGHVVLAPDLKGMGDDPTPLPSVTLAGWADQVAELVLAVADPVVLVGHSRGGIVISEVAERVPERLHALVYVAAFLVPSGQSLGAVAASVPRQLDDSLIVPRGDGTALVDPRHTAAAFYNTTDPDLVRRANARLGPEPMWVFATPLRLSAERFGTVPRAYVECTDDRAIPLALQRSMQAALPCDPVITLVCDHSPFYSAPTQLAECLLLVA